MKKKLGYGLLLCTVALLSALVGAGLYLLNYALQPQELRDAKERRAYADMYRHYPFLQAWVDSLQQAEALRDTFILAPDGKRLHAIYAAAQQPTTHTAVIVHGYTDSAVRMLMIGHLYHHELGYNILLPDLRYHGQSEGEAIQMGWKDRLDVRQWMDVAHQTFGCQTQMVVHGISMGAATTMMLAGDPQPRFVHCFVEDCGYTDVWDEFAHELSSSFGLPSFPLMHTASLLCRLRYGWSFAEASALRQVARCRLPMLFIHGAQDDYVPTEMVYRLYEAKPGPKELWVVEGAAHAMAYRENRQEYARRVANFVGQYIR